MIKVVSNQLMDPPPPPPPNVTLKAVHSKNVHKFPSSNVYTKKTQVLENMSSTVGCRR